MMFSSRASQRSSAPIGPAALWEAPQDARARPDRSSRYIEGSLTVSGALSFLRENGRRIAILTLALFALGVVVLVVLPVRFAATALVVVDPREQRVTTDQEVLPGIGQDAAALQSLIEIAKSDGFLRLLIEQLKVASDEDIAGGKTDTTRLLENFRKHLDISRRGLTYVIAISFTSNSPDKAAHYANAVAEAFVANQRNAHTEATDDAAGWLKDRLKTLSEQLRASDDAVAAFKLEHKIVNAGKESTTQQLRVTDLTQQVATARARAGEAKSRYEQAQHDLKANVESPIKQDLLSMLRAQRSALNDQIAQKKAVFGDRHPDLVVAYSQLDDLNKRIEVERKKNIDTAKSEYDSLLEQQSSLEKQLKAVETQMLVDGQAQVKLQELQRVADANRNIYEQFLARFKSTSEQRLLQNSQVNIASPAVPPLHSTRPPLALLLAALLIASMLASTAGVAVMKGAPEKPAPPVRLPGDAPTGGTTRQQLRRSTSVAPPPAVLPILPATLPVWARIPDLAPASSRTVSQRLTTTTNDIDVGSYLRPLLEKVEPAQGAGGKVALVLSVGKSSGGNTVARSLNRSALNTGLLSVLVQVQPEFGGAWNEAADRQDGLTIIGARSATELLGAGKEGGLGAPYDIRSEFDLVIVHASCLALQPDAIMLAAHADLIILVVRASEVGSAAMRRVTAALTGFGRVPSGLVINHIPAGSTASLPASAVGVTG